MRENTFQEISNLIKKSKNILILTHARADCDGLGASLAAYSLFNKMGKSATVVTSDPAPENLHFLPSIDILHNSLGSSNDFVITVDSANTAIGKIKYNVEGKKVNIIITPKDGQLTADDISFSQSAKKYDLIVVFDTGNLEHLGALYEQNTEMFYNIPIINIDHHASNTDFGQVNLVDVTAASATEVFYYYLEYLENKTGKSLIDEDMATLLLAGIITDTGSFQHANTSPKSMETSAKLLDRGARQQEVIKNIYKTKKLSTLKLWGTILSKVQVDPKHRMVWSSLAEQDFQEAGASPEETEGIIDDLLTNAPGAEVIFLIKKNPDYVSISMRSTSNQVDVGKFAAENGGGGHVRAAGFRVHDDKPFDQIVSDVISRVQAFQSKRLGLAEEVSVETEELAVEPKESQEDRSSEESEETYLDFSAPEEGSAEVVDVEENIDEVESMDSNESEADDLVESEETELFEEESENDTENSEDEIDLFEEEVSEEPTPKTEPKKEEASEEKAEDQPNNEDSLEESVVTIDLNEDKKESLKEDKPKKTPVRRRRKKAESSEGSGETN